VFRLGTPIFLYMEFNIGVLLPQSNAFPTMGKEFVRGLKLALKNDDVKLLVEGIGFGENPKQLINLAQKLYTQEDVFLITGLLGHRGISELSDFVSATEELLIFSDVGAKLPQQLNNKKGVFCNSFDLCESAYVTGKEFVKNNFKNVAISSCYYDSGYDFTRALELGMEQSESQFCGHFITPHQPRENEAELMISFMEENNPDVVFASHNGIFAEEHAGFLAKNNILSKGNIYANPFSVSDHVLDAHPALFDGVKSIATWFPELNNPINQQFVSDYQQQHQITPSVFALLGFENGLVIKNVLKEKALNRSDVEKCLLAENVVMGPRGSLTFNPETHRTHFKHYKQELMFDKNNGAYLKNIQEVQSDKAKDKGRKIRLANSLNQENGWHNAYLCH
jgi:branched-chain amino acid transport system substrate-binding protein